MNAFATLSMPKGTSQKTAVLSARVKKDLADRFAAAIAGQGYLNPSDALRDVIRQWVARHDQNSTSRKAA